MNATIVFSVKKTSNCTKFHPNAEKKFFVRTSLNNYTKNWFNNKNVQIKNECKKEKIYTPQKWFEYQNADEIIFE